jgi:putative DNA primase/helicase
MNLGCAEVARSALGEPAKRQGAELLWRCPRHDDRHPSLSVNTKKNCWACFPCNTKGTAWSLAAFLAGLSADDKPAVTAWLRERGLIDRNGQGGGGRRIVATYDYRDESGKLLFQTVRYQPKDFRQRRPDGKGGWIWNLEGVTLVPYRLPEWKDKAVVYIVEGEKDADALWRLGLPASCNPLGAGKWREEYNQHFRSKRVVILPDNDPPGEAHAVDVARRLLPVAAAVKIVRLPGLAAKGDLSDWLAAGGTRAKLAELVKAATVVTAADLAEVIGQQEGGHDDGVLGVVRGDEWPAPARIAGELPPVEPFTEELLPDSFRSLAVDIAERMQVPLDYPAVSLVLCLAGAVNRRATIQPKANDTGWVVVPNLWGGIIAPPGFMKSPVIQAATRPLLAIQTDWRGEHEEAMAEHARAVEEWELKKSVWCQEYKKSVKQSLPAPERPPDQPMPPVCRRLIVNDATFEALHQTMAENPAGVFVIRDELTGWWAMLDRAGREGERAFCLQAWLGDTGHTIDRIGRGTIHVEACCMSMLGGIQPGRLRSYLADALHDGPSNDGLIQRFQLLVWPDTQPGWTYVDRPPDAMAEQQAARIFLKLTELDPENPSCYRFSPDAQELFIDWLAELEEKLRGDELHPAVVSHLSKFRKTMPALALLFQMADWTADNGGVGVVSLDHARQAAAWTAYLEDHARRVYSCITTPQLRAARELAGKIKSRVVGGDGSFTCRDVYLKGWTGLDSPEAVRLAADLLADAGWLREQNDAPGPSGGRPSSRYWVNPKVYNDAECSEKEPVARLAAAVSAVSNNGGASR